jgi:hypothetical protein
MAIVKLIFSFRFFTSGRKPNLWYLEKRRSNPAFDASLLKFTGAAAAGGSHV